jgi:hypothetical protein
VWISKELAKTKTGTWGCEKNMRLDNKCHGRGRNKKRGKKGKEMRGVGKTTRFLVFTVSHLNTVSGW